MFALQQKYGRQRNFSFLEVWGRQMFFNHLCEWVCYDLYYLDHDWWLLAQLDPSGLVAELFSLFLSFKNESCKIIKKHCKLQGFGLRRGQTWANTRSKSGLFVTLKILQKPCKTQGFRHQASTKKRSKQKHVSFLCGQKRFFYNSWFCLGETEVSEC